MSTFYDEAIATALAAITEAGQTWTLARFTKTFDPVVGSTSAIVATKGSVAAVVLPLNKTDKNELDDTLMEALRAGKLRKLLVAASGVPFAPAGTDVFVRGAEVWLAKGSTALAPAGTAIIYTVIVEAGSLSTADQAALVA